MSPEADPGMEGMLIGRVKADETPIGQKLEEPEEYDADEQVVGEVDLEKQQQNFPFKISSGYWVKKKIQHIVKITTSC